MNTHTTTGNASDAKATDAPVNRTVQDNRDENHFVTDTTVMPELRHFASATDFGPYNLSRRQ